MSGLNMGYRGRTTRGPSGNIFNSKFRIDQILSDPSKGSLLFEDFRNFGGTVDSNVGTYVGESGSWKSYEDTGGSIAQRADEVTGVIRLTTDATDNDEVWLQSCYGAGVLGMVSDSVPYLQAFEARVRFGQIGNTFNAFIGMSEEGLAAADTFTDAGAMADKDFLGYRVLEADGDELDAMYKKSGQTEVEVIDGAQALVANTWYKIGWLYDPSAPSSKKIQFFIDNVDQGTYVTAASIAAATFPDGEELSILLGVKNGSAAASYIDVDWVAQAIVYE